jgi:D-alanyl-lipoteichoic acid acyltransferase DltB (MBOAT superfamily)
MKAEHDLIAFALYVTWHPHLVAGPIMRAKRLLPQLREDPRFDLGKISDGVLLIVWGLFEKMVIGDRAALITNAIFGSDAQAAATRTGVDWYIAVVAFAIQIFGDFSGYSDIARGTSRLFGVELIVNFRHPYFAIGPQDFWRRWHISLSTWLRDYLYFSLGGNRKGKLRTKINLFITMLLGGLWHGAAWHYVIWGAYHGTLLTIERALGLDVREPRTLGGRIFRIVLMFQLTLFGWLLFRVESMDQLRQIIAAVARPPVFTEEAKSWARTLSVLAAPLLMVQLNQAQRQSMEVLPGAKDLGRIVFSLTAVALMILFHVRTRIEFIYFQF